MSKKKSKRKKKSRRMRNAVRRTLHIRRPKLSSAPAKKAKRKKRARRARKNPKRSVQVVRVARGVAIRGISYSTAKRLARALRPRLKRGVSISAHRG